MLVFDGTSGFLLQYESDGALVADERLVRDHNASGIGSRQPASKGNVLRDVTIALADRAENFLGNEDATRHYLGG